MKIHEYDGVKLVEEECITFKKGILFLGFSGPGMNGLVVTDILNQLLEMKEIGRIRCALLPPLSSLKRGL